ncbi:MAG: hypothetical protein JOZ44_08550, partial [Acidobacteria bacterium]|nr:hypothetical protein [Acidobacteriota bacterium]
MEVRGADKCRRAVRRGDTLQRNGDPNQSTRMQEVVTLGPSAANPSPESPDRGPQSSGGISAVWLYAVVVFLSAFLLFQVQLIIAKYILPWFGGSPSVWNTCMLVFQVLLLGGYAYSHLLSRHLPARTQRLIHLTLLAASLVVLLALARSWHSPITPSAAWKPNFKDNPILKVSSVLLVAIGFPFFLLSTTGPLLQVWFSRSQRQAPYRLYALSNAGSLLGLVSYPFLVERLRVQSQAWIWSTGYIAFLVMCGVCAWLFADIAGESREALSPAPASAPNPAFRFALWLTLPACSAAALLATTNLICQEVAVIPLLWVLPLCLYLLTFILAFDSDRWYRRGVFHLLYGVGFLLALFALSKGPGIGILPQVGIYCFALFAICMVCHGELAGLRPESSHVSTFYLAIAAGGALGSALVVLVAPLVFRQVWEFHLSLLLCGILLLTVVWRDRASWFYRGLIYRSALGVMILLLIAAGYEYRVSWIRQQEQRTTLLRERNFFGVKSIQVDATGVWLKHGQIMHGVQLKDRALRDEPTLYYKRLSGIGLALDRYPRRVDSGGRPSRLRVGIVGMGTATLAAYGRPGDYFRFYEIDPQVIGYSVDPRLLGFHQSRPPIFTF